MKAIFSGLLYALIVTTAWGQSEPITTIQGDQGTKFGSPKLVTPNLQATKTAKGGRIETGNGNLLANPSFEHTTVNTGWTCSLGSVSASTGTDGLQALGLNSIGAGTRCYQLSTTNAANLKGLLGSAILKVKTTDSIYKVCGLVDGNAATNERNCITVRPTSTDLPFYPARTDFYMGGTSNGIVVYTTTTTSQPTVIDDAFVGVFNGGLSQFSNNTGWVKFTPTSPNSSITVGVNDCYSKRNETNLDIACEITAGTPAGSEARIALPNSAIVASTFASKKSVGYYFRGNSSGSHGGAVMASSGNNYITFSDYGVFGGPTVNSAANALASNSFDSGAINTIVASIPIAGWEANTNAAIAGCVDAVSCTDNLTAKASSTDVVSDENVNFINGDCTNATTGQGTCNFVTGTFPTSVPNCTITPVARATQVFIVSQSNTAITYETRNSAGAAAASAVNISCQKTGADFKPKTVVVSPLQGYVKVPGAENLNVETFSVSYGTTNNNTVCSASPCSYLDQIGTGASSVTRSGAGIYSLVATKTYSKLKCTANVGITSSSVAAIHPNTPLMCTSCSSLNFQTTDGSIKDSFGTLVCQGTY